MLIHNFASLGISPLRLALFSCGLGNINRGFEVSTARFFRALDADPELDVRLFAGGHFDRAARVWNIGRNAWLNAGVRWWPGMNDNQRWRLAYIFEQVSFSFGLMGHAAARWQPDVVWTKEVPLAHVLYHFRQLAGLKYKIIFSNGGGFRPGTYSKFDFVHHLQSDAYAEAIEAGVPAEKMTIIPNLVPAGRATRSREELRRIYNIAPDDWVVICVAAWNTHHKRIDYLIEETARVGDPKIRLILCGQPEPEGEPLKALAERLLPGRCSWYTVGEDQVQELLKLSDVFVLPSLYEGLGAVIIEAAAAGLPIICHPHSGSKFIVQDNYWLPDLSTTGALEARLRSFKQNMPPPERVRALCDNVSARFNERKIADDFKDMVARVHSLEPAKLTQTT